MSFNQVYNDTYQAYSLHRHTDYIKASQSLYLPLDTLQIYIIDVSPGYVHIEPRAYHSAPNKHT